MTSFTVGSLYTTAGCVSRELFLLSVGEFMANRLSIAHAEANSSSVGKLVTFLTCNSEFSLSHIPKYWHCL